MGGAVGSAAAYPVDPMVNRRLPPLPVPPRMSPARCRRCNREHRADRSAIASRTLGESAPWIVRTALCVEPRDGRLHVFMPPLHVAEDYIDLLTAIEDTAAHLEMPVVIEGYPPPRRSAHQPDQGDARSGRDRSEHPSRRTTGRSWSPTPPRSTKTRASRRLGTEKFMLDGRHTGTGGGNHFVLGGPTPADSPFLRRPDLLRSMIGYWLNHPSLSYAVLGHVHRTHQPGAARR